MCQEPLLVSRQIVHGILLHLCEKAMAAERRAYKATHTSSEHQPLLREFCPGSLHGLHHTAVQAGHRSPVSAKKGHFELCWRPMHTGINAVNRTAAIGTSSRALLQMLLLGVQSHPASTSTKVGNPAGPPRPPMEFGVASTLRPGSLLHSYSWVPAAPFSSDSLLPAVFLILALRSRTRSKRHTQVSRACREVPWPPWLPSSASFSCSFTPLHCLMMACPLPQNKKESFAFLADKCGDSCALQLRVSSYYLKYAICHLRSTSGDAELAVFAASCSVG